MKVNSSQLDNQFVKLKNDAWLTKQRFAGKVVAKTLNLLESLVKEKTTKSLIELDAIAKQFIIDNECTPTFLLYKGFPNSVCISVNKQLVHGIPTDYKLQDGDLVSFDLGATIDGVIADSAITCIYGEPKSNRHIELIKATEEALYAGINAIEVGKRIGVIGNAIYKTANAKGFAVVEKFGGHGISIDDNGEGIPHAQPFISNRSKPNEGVRMQSGMTIAIEPLLVIGSSNKTITGSDTWTVYTENISCHYEHTIYVHNDYVEIITDRNI